MTDRAAEEGSNPGDGEAVQAAAPVNQGQVPNEAGSVKQRQGGRRNADEYKEITEGEEVHVTLIRDKDAKGRSREDYVGVCLSKVAKASQLQLSDDRMTVTGQKGYSTVRASHGVFQGSWYCEFEILSLGNSGHVRIGLCTKKAELQAPVGFDEHGYAFRDLDGSKVHSGKREAYTSATFGQGDVIGVLVLLPEGGHPIEAQSKKMVRYKGEIYYEEEKEKVPEVLTGSSIEFFVNGRAQGEAFGSFMEGTWYPAVSIFSKSEQDKVSVKVNFGPDFKHPPSVPHPWRPWSEVSPGA